jgi:N-methylhydantoinase B/oxoprolinase/acetone carboxylase alpha subunit
MGCGGGARYDKDGQDSSVNEFNPWTDCGDVETEEVGPVLMFSRRQRADSGGLGKYRGGVACQSIYTPHASPVTFFGLSGSGGYVSEVQGMYGGYPTPANTLDIVYDSDIFERGKNKQPIPHSIDELDQVGGKREKVYPSAASRAPARLSVVIFIAFFWGGGEGLGIRLKEIPNSSLKTLKTI